MAPNLALKGDVRSPSLVVAPISVNFGRESLMLLASGPFPTIIERENLPLLDKGSLQCGQTSCVFRQ